MEVLLVMFPVGECHAPDALQELYEFQTEVLRPVQLFILYCHFGEGIAYLEHVFVDKACLYGKDAVGLMHLEMRLVNSQGAFVELVQLM